MKWIFTFFILFFSFCATAQEEQLPSSILSVAEFVEKTKNQLQTAQKSSSEDLYQQAPSWTTALYADEKSMSPITGTEGATPWTQTTFGRIRLLTCHTGTQNLNNLWLTLDTEMKTGWSIHIPQLVIRPTPQITKVQVFIPKLPPFDGKTPKQFVKSASFPVHLQFTETEAPLTINMDTSFEACFQNNCQIIQSPISITLPHTQSKPSPFCPYIRRSMTYVPPEASKEELFFFLTPENYLQIRASFEKKAIQPQVLLTQGKQIFYQMLSQEIAQNKVNITLLPQNWSPTDPITVTILNRRQIMEKTMIPSPGRAPNLSFSFPQPHKTLPFILFFLTTPLMSYLLHVFFKNEYITRRKSLFIACVYILSGVLFQFLFHYLSNEHLYESLFWAWSMGIIFILAAFFIRHLTLLSFIILTFLTPLIYLYPLIQCAENWLFIQLACIAALPYLLFAYAPSLGVNWSRFTQKLSPLWKRLPLLANAAVWALILLCLVYHTLVPTQISQKNPQAELTLISPPWHIKGTLFDITATQLSTGKELQKKGILSIKRQTPQSKIDIQTETIPLFPFALLKGEKLSEPLILKPTLSTYQLTDYFNSAFK